MAVPVQSDVDAPLATLEFASSVSAKVTAAALLAVAAFGATAGLRRQIPPTPRVVVQLLTLFATAVFVWLRPGVSNLQGSLPWALLPAACAIALAGAAANLFAPERYVRALTDFAGRRRMALLIVVVSLSSVLTLASAAAPVARHWDESGWMDSHSYDVFAFNIATGKQVYGSSEYMPVYQYGMALVDLIFGHVFFVQQLVNVLLAVGATAAVCLAAWHLFESLSAVAVAGVWMAFTPQFYRLIHLTQIETWYVPIVCLLLAAWAWYWRRPSLASCACLATLAALGVNTRNQGTPFFLVMALAPLCVPALRPRPRLVHAAVIAGVAVLSLMPWTLRNYRVEHRFSASASRTASYVGALNDRRIGFYGIRYWDGFDTVMAEYEARYPVPDERQRALWRAGWDHVASDPKWLTRAIFWRSVAFYGLLPPGLLEIARPRQTDWPMEWKSFVFDRTAPLLLLPLSVVAVFLIPTRTRALLVAGILATLAIVVVAASAEDRISYPVLPLHILLVAGLWDSVRRTSAPPGPRVFEDRGRLRSTVLVSTVALGCALAICRVTLGSRYLYRPLVERAIAVSARVDVASTLPLVNRWFEAGAETAAIRALKSGDLVRLRCMLSNYMFPPKGTGAVPGLPAFATDPRRETYYYAYLLSDADRPVIVGTIPLAFLGAETSDGLREGDVAEVEASVVSIEPQGMAQLWLHARRVKKLPLLVSQLPAFLS